MTSWRLFVKVSGFDLLCWGAIGAGALYLGARIAPHVIGKLLLWSAR